MRQHLDAYEKLIPTHIPAANNLSGRIKIPLSIFCSNLNCMEAYCWLHGAIHLLISLILFCNFSCIQIVKFMILRTIFDIILLHLYIPQDHQSRVARHAIYYLNIREARSALCSVYCRHQSVVTYVFQGPALTEQDRENLETIFKLFPEGSTCELSMLMRLPCYQVRRGVCSHYELWILTVALT